MRFEQFCRIDEKVSKSEINEALRNSNIIIGAEFEFIHDDLKEMAGNKQDDYYQEMYDNAMNDYNGAIREYEKYERDYSDLQYEQSELETELEEIEDELTDKEAEIMDEQDNDVPDRSVLSELRSDLKQLKSRKSEIKERLEEIENERDELYIPSVGRYYIDYMNEMGQSYNEYWWEDGDLEEPWEPPESDTSSLDDQDSWVEIVKDNFDSLFGSFPLNVDIRVTGYGNQKQKSGDKYWKAEYDSSIAEEGGIELITPPMTLPEFIDICPKVMDWIRQYGDTNRSCGFHVHMGINGVSNLNDAMDPIKLILLTDEGYIWNFFEDRRHNLYTTPSKDFLAKRNVERSDVELLINKEKLKRGIDGGHYDSINFQSADKGHIEFRQMGGNNYHEKWNNIKAIIAHHAHNLSVACDPTWKQREYSLRLTRLYNKVDNSYYIKLINTLGIIDKYLKKVVTYEGDLTDDEKRVVNTGRTYIEKQANKIYAMIKSSGDIPDKKTIQTLEQNKSYQTNSNKFISIEVGNLLSFTKISQISMIYEYISKYIITL